MVHPSTRGEAVVANDRTGSGLGNKAGRWEPKLLRHREGVRRSSELDAEGGAQREVGGAGQSRGQMEEGPSLRPVAGAVVCVCQSQHPTCSCVCVCVCVCV